MSVEQLDIVDIISINSAGKVVLTVSDHLDWSNSTAHQTLLESKLNKYLAFIESGEIFSTYPDARNRSLQIKVIFKYRPDSDALEFLARAKEIVESVGFEFKHELFAQSYDN